MARVGRGGNILNLYVIGFFFFGLINRVSASMTTNTHVNGFKVAQMSCDDARFSRSTPSRTVSSVVAVAVVSFTKRFSNESWICMGGGGLPSPL